MKYLDEGIKYLKLCIFFNKVNLATTDPETKYIGFYVQARDENDNPVGVFTPNTDTKVHNCFGKRSVSCR